MTEGAIAIVVSVHADGLRLKFGGETEAGTKHYKHNKAVTFSAGQRVYCARISGTYIVICPI